MGSSEASSSRRTAVYDCEMAKVEKRLQRLHSARGAGCQGARKSKNTLYEVVGPVEEQLPCKGREELRGPEAHLEAEIPDQSGGLQPLCDRAEA